ncbi:MAG: PQQ-binding-like beta-propeller repeat protein [Pirellulales bacterium]
MFRAAVNRIPVSLFVTAAACWSFGLAHAQPSNQVDSVAANRTIVGESDLVGLPQPGTADQELLLEQIDQLVPAGQLDEALSQLARLADESRGILMNLGPAQRAGTQTVQTAVTMDRYLAWHTAALAKLRPELIDLLQERWSKRTAKSVENQLQERDFSGLRRTVDEDWITEPAFQGRLAAIDAALDRGATIAARQLLQSPACALSIESNRSGTEDQIVAWPWLVRSSKTNVVEKSVGNSVEAFLSRHADQLRRSIGNKGEVTRDLKAAAENRLVEVCDRLLRCAALDASDEEFPNTITWMKSIAAFMSNDGQERLASSLARSQSWRIALASRDRSRDFSNEWPMFAGNTQRHSGTVGSIRLPGWSSWTRPLERVTAQSDRTPASKPPVAENSTGTLSSFPALHGGRVYVHELTRIMAYELDSGKVWPQSDPPVPLFESGIAFAEFMPLGYPTVGVPRGTLTIHENKLFARMGPAVTGYIGKTGVSDGGSASYLVGLDLDRQGSMLPGYPIRFAAPETKISGMNTNGAPEFEGCPVVVGDRLLVAAALRDNVGLRRYVAMFDAEGGKFRRLSPLLASGIVSGAEQANLISHQLLTVGGGRVFVSTNLGAIVCLDPDSGEIVWHTRYRRARPAADDPYPLAARYRYRDLTPCMLVGTLLVCAPKDCPEVFALDTVTGTLVWSTSADETNTVTQLLGCVGDSVVVAGDRLLWIDRVTGRIQQSFPAAVPTGTVNALASPRASVAESSREVKLCGRLRTSYLSSMSRHRVTLSMHSR